MSLGISQALSFLMSLSAFPCFYGIGPVDFGSSSKNFRWDEDITLTVKVSFTLISISWTQLMACQCSPLTCPLRRRCFPWVSTILLSRVFGKCKYEIYIFQISNKIETVHSLSNFEKLSTIECKSTTYTILPASGLAFNHISKLEMDLPLSRHIGAFSVMTNDYIKDTSWPLLVDSVKLCPSICLHFKWSPFIIYIL